MSQLDRLRKEYNFDSWRDARAPGEQVFVWRFRLSGGSLHDWRASRIQYVEVPSAPPTNLSIWQSESGGDRQLFSLDVYETASRAAAREYLLRLLGEFQGPALERRDRPGEVAFGKGDAVILFAHGNVVVLARSVERSTAPVTSLATQFDDYLSRRPEAVVTAAENGFTVRVAETLAQGTERPGQLVRLVIEGPRTRTHVWYKLFSATGEIRLEQGEPAFAAAAPGTHEILVAAVDPDGKAVTRRLTLP